MRFPGDGIRGDYKRALAGAFDGQRGNNLHAARAEQLRHGPEDRGLGQLDRIERWIGKHPALPAVLEEIDLADTPAVVDDPVFFGKRVDFDQTIRMAFAGSGARKGMSHLGHVERTDLAMKFIALGRVPLEQKRIEKEADLFVQAGTRICELQGLAV